MPPIRVFGNSLLSLINKMASGYWDSMDPTNGFTAIHADALRRLPFDKIDKGYFFESDMLFRLNINRCVVKDIPMAACYADEKSNLRISVALFEFPLKLLRNCSKRLFYNYFLRDFNAGTIQLCLGLFFTTFGILFGGYYWIRSIFAHIPSTSGTVMVAALPIIIGSQLLISFINFDSMNIPKECIHGKS